LIGASLGLALSEASPILARRVLDIGGALTPLITPGVILSSLGLALVVALLGSVPAAWRVSRLKVVDALVER
jgi:ABC-type antimicrobial peptide transport system permease subunit